MDATKGSIPSTRASEEFPTPTCSTLFCPSHNLLLNLLLKEKESQRINVGNLVFLIRKQAHRNVGRPHPNYVHADNDHAESGRKTKGFNAGSANLHNMNKKNSRKSKRSETAQFGRAQ